MMKYKVQLLSIATALVLAACSNTQSTQSSTKSSNTTKDTISVMSMLHTAAPPSGDVQAKLEEHTGKKIEFNWVPDASKDERLNAALASNNLADIVSLQQINNTTIRNAMASGLFWDVEPYLQDYPHLKEISKDRLESSRVAGHIYGVPFQKNIARYGVLVRKDWLDNLGLEVPHTIADLEKVAQAFTEQDPDGNGVKDTVGFVDRAESFNFGFRTLTGYFGAGNWFVVKDNKVEPAFMQSEYQQAMDWYKKIYDNGWMNSDFSIMTKNDQKDYIVQGKGGIVVIGLQEVQNYVSGAKGTAQEGMQWALVNDMTFGNIPRRIISDTNGGMGGWLAIPKSNVKNEDELKVVLQFINDLMDEEAFTLMTMGIEGVHYMVNDQDVYEKIDDKKWQQEVQPYAATRPSELVKLFKTKNELLNEASEKIVENEPYAVINPAQALQSATYDQEWSTLIEPVQDAYYRYVMGEIDKAGYDDVIQHFLSSGGQAIIDEFTASYQGK